MHLLCIPLITVMLSLPEGPQQSWDQLAEPWMTHGEKALFQTLSDSEKVRFRGWFCARRAKNPDQWSPYGLFLPVFFPKTQFGDIRDQIQALLGEPHKVETSAVNTKLPTVWHYPDYLFRFELKDGKITLAEEAVTAWENAKQTLILHPDLRYDFRDHAFGRLRLPENLTYIETTVGHQQIIPESQGGRIRLYIELPDTFKKAALAQVTSPKQKFELLLFLKPENGMPIEAADPEFVRHDTAYGNLDQEGPLYFETYLPNGRFQAEFVCYSGFFNVALRGSHTITVAPPDLPRIGQPLITKTREKAGITAAKRNQITVAGYHYTPPERPLTDNSGAFALVRSEEPCQLILQAPGREETLTPIEQDGHIKVFKIPDNLHVHRFVAVGGNDPNLQAVSTIGALNFPDHDLLRLDQVDSASYLKLEELTVSGVQGPVTLFVNGVGYARSAVGRFPWPAFDWGETASLSFEYKHQGQTHRQTFTLPRGGVFQNLQVRSRHLLVGTLNQVDIPEASPFEILVEDQVVPPQSVTPIKDLPKLWGVVVNDPLLSSTEWPEIRAKMQRYLKKLFHSGDQVYIVQISTRPQLILPPTRNKAAVSAVFESLRPVDTRENAFTVRYLLDALTHLPQHGTLPHQVILLTHRLTEDTEQMETLLPYLRRTGLQLYNFEFPFAFQEETESRFQKLEEDPLVTMKVRDEADRRTYGALRDNFQEDSNVTAGYSIRFKKRKKEAEREAKNQALVEEAFIRAFNRQVAALTAGLSPKEDYGKSAQTLEAFLDQLLMWQDQLQHVELNLPYIDPSMIAVRTQPGHTGSWTLVPWSVKSSN